MADIKTKDSVQSIKVFNRTSKIARGSLNEAERLKNQIKENTETANENENNYAVDKIEQETRRTEQKAIDKSVNTTRKVIHKTKRLIDQYKKDRLEERLSKTTGKTVKRTGKAVHDGKKTAEAAKKTTEATAKAAKRAAEAAKKAAQAAARAAKEIAHVIVTAVKAIVAGIKALIAAIAAGGWVAVLIIVIICIIGLVVAALFGWLIPKDGGYSIQSSIYGLKSSYAERIEEIKRSCEYDNLVFEGDQPDYKGTVALFAVVVNLDPEDPKSLDLIDDAMKEKLDQLFWNMTDVTYQIDLETETQLVELVGENGEIHQITEEVITTILTIRTDVAEVWDLAEKQGLSSKQMELLRELLSQDFDEMWQGII